MSDLFPVETEMGGPLANSTCGLREYDVGGHDCYLPASVLNPLGSTFTSCQNLVAGNEFHKVTTSTVKLTPYWP